MFMYLNLLNKKGNVPCQGIQNLELKISRFSCMKEIAYKSVINGPTFTKCGSYAANFVSFKN